MSVVHLSSAARARVICPLNECEAGYQLQAAFPDFPEVLRAWQSASAALRTRLLSQSDVAYGTAPLQRFDFYRAPGTHRPLLLFIHGGYWQGGDKSDIGFIAAPYVRAGISVAVMNYSLAPQARIEDMLDEVKALLFWLQQMAVAMDIDCSRISLMGHSAGAHLACHVAAQPGAAPIRAVFAVSGVFDLAPLLPTSLNRALSLDAARADQLSPVLLDGPGTTRVHTIIGAQETAQFHRQAAVIGTCWPQVVAHHVVPDTHHYTVLWPLADHTHALCQTIIGELLA